MVTRPSLPVPVTSSILILSSLRKPRTAGVASAACFSTGAISFVSPDVPDCCSAAFCGCCGSDRDPACSAGGAKMASFSGDMSLWTSMSQSGLTFFSFDVLNLGVRQSLYLAHLCYILRFIVQPFYHSVESGCDLLIVNRCYCHSERVIQSTSVIALSDWTSQILSNCSTRAPGSTNHCMICTSLIPVTDESKSIQDQPHILTFSDIRE